MGVIIHKRVFECVSGRLRSEERTASVVIVCLNGAPVTVCGVPAGRF